MFNINKTGVVFIMCYASQYICYLQVIRLLILYLSNVRTFGDTLLQVLCQIKLNRSSKNVRQTVYSIFTCCLLLFLLKLATY